MNLDAVPFSVQRGRRLGRPLVGIPLVLLVAAPLLRAQVQSAQEQGGWSIYAQDNPAVSPASLRPAASAPAAAAIGLSWMSGTYPNLSAIGPLPGYGTVNALLSNMGTTTAGTTGPGIITGMSTYLGASANLMPLTSGVARDVSGLPQVENFVSGPWATYILGALSTQSLVLMNISWATSQQVQTATFNQGVHTVLLVAFAINPNGTSGTLSYYDPASARSKTVDVNWVSIGGYLFASVLVPNTLDDPQGLSTGAVTSVFVWSNFPPAAGGTAVGTAATLYSSTGARAVSHVIEASDGNFYGTTSNGGAANLGAVFRMNPADGTISILHSFGGALDGSNPGAVIQGRDGNLYGVTAQGGASGGGTVYKLDLQGNLTGLVAFNGTNGGSPATGGLLQASDGNFYGATQNGGSSGLGTIFKLTSDGSSLTTLVNFDGANGANPESALTEDPRLPGNLFGTTFNGGANDLGTAFLVQFDGTIGNSLSFNGANGAHPATRLCVGYDDRLYGTTVDGGASNLGVFFQFDISAGLKLLASFNGANGAHPSGGGVIQFTNGLFYGATEAGGANGNGTLFQATAGGLLIDIYDFNGAAGTGTKPEGNLILSSDGGLYGTTNAGGANGGGTVFRLQVEPAEEQQPPNGLPPNNGAPPDLALGTDQSPYALPAFTVENRPITYAVVSGPASLSGDNLVFSGPGTVVLSASAPGTGMYAPFSETVTITVSRVDSSPVLPPGGLVLLALCLVGTAFFRLRSVPGRSA